MAFVDTVSAFYKDTISLNYLYIILPVPPVLANNLGSRARHILVAGIIKANDQGARKKVGCVFRCLFSGGAE